MKKIAFWLIALTFISTSQVWANEPKADATADHGTAKEEKLSKEDAQKACEKEGLKDKALEECVTKKTS